MLGCRILDGSRFSKGLVESLSLDRRVGLCLVDGC